jgi:hypothetical protein
VVRNNFSVERLSTDSEASVKAALRHWLQARQWSSPRRIPSSWDAVFSTSSAAVTVARLALRIDDSLYSFSISIFFSETEPSSMIDSLALARVSLCTRRWWSHDW